LGATTEFAGSHADEPLEGATERRLGSVANARSDLRDAFIARAQ
jgi:hypothetical protein